jgi:hypothetical protein
MPIGQANRDKHEWAQLDSFANRYEPQAINPNASISVTAPDGQCERQGFSKHDSQGERLNSRGVHSIDRETTMTARQANHVPNCAWMSNPSSEG